MDTLKLGDFAARLSFRAKPAQHSANEYEWQRRATKWRCTLTLDGRRMSVLIYMGPAHGNRPPKVDEVLELLASNAAAAKEDFAEFCANRGYDPDSRRVELVWKTCKSLATRLKRLFVDEYEALLATIES